MKVPALLTALAVACGSTFAMGNSNSGDRHAAADQHYSAGAQPQHEGPIAKTRRALHRMGDKMRHMGGNARRSTQREDNEYALNHNDKNATNRNDTRNMGAAGSGAQDSARQQRMDEAYAHWKAQQKR